MKFITQGETSDLTANNNLEIVEANAPGNELTTLPTTTAAPLPIIWLTNDVKTETITAMIATEQYAIRIYADIEKDAADVPGYRCPLLLMEQVFLSLPGVDNERLLTKDDENDPDPNDIEIPVEYVIARDFCYEVFASSPLKESQEYDLHLSPSISTLRPINPVLPFHLQFLSQLPSLTFPFHLRKRKQRKNLVTSARSAGALTSMTTSHGHEVRLTAIPAVARTPSHPLLLLLLFHSHHALALPLLRPPLLSKQTPLLSNLLRNAPSLM